MARAERRRATISKKMRETVHWRDNWRCFYCGRDMSQWAQHKYRGTLIQIDHMIPFVKGGADEFWNYVTSCRTCNIQKKGHSLEAFREMRKQRLIGLVELYLEHGDLLEHIRCKGDYLDLLAYSIIAQGQTPMLAQKEFRFMFYGENVRRIALQSKA
jgi:hypothetical protein